MPLFQRKQKSFLQNTTWIWMMMLVMGIVFLAIATIFQLIPISPESVTVTVNGVRQPHNESSVRTFRLLFLLVFGGVGIVMTVIGGVIARRSGTQRRLARTLKEDGVHITAEVVECSHAAVRVNHRHLLRLRCAYSDGEGKTIIFKSGLLRSDPTPYLLDGKVDVYYDPQAINRYFVDVDGSAGLGTSLIEL